MTKLIAALTIIGLAITAIVGWFINLIGTIKLAVAGASISTLFVVKIIGIFVAPLGSILGLFF